ncbi:hypothetical protein VP1G_02291 [Cytospora mali]|uniref:SH3 domain-containing protein n=1 Tax=Cytospora mali TaxID=578113 RepID=A0A194UTB1_CYTMA|nr:hypothetical protein VP1G_02291 [Valsa mali var. pyri (nom. inval.)]
MLHKRSHVHRRKPDDGGFLGFGDSLGDLADEIASPFTQPKRVVTVYKTKTPEGWTGGVLTTLDRTTPTSDAAPIVTSTQSNDDEATPTTTRSTAKETTAKETTAREVSAKETADTTLAIATSTSSTSSTSDDDSVPTAIIASTASRSDTSGALAMATEAPTSSSSLLSTTAAGSTAASSTDASAASATQSASTSSSSGSGDGATKAGIAIGVLAGIFIVLAIVYFVIRKRKRQLREERLADDEKLSGPFESQPPATPAKAPRLSLRPMTQLFMGAPGSADRRMSKGPQQAIGMVASPTMKRAPGADAGERPMTSESQNVYNPFGNHAETIVEEPGTPRNPTSPMSPNSEVSTHMPSPTFAAGLSPAPRASAITTDSAVPAPTVIISSPHSTDATFSPLQANPLQANPVGQAISTPTASEAAALFAGATTGAAAGTLASAGLQRKQSVRKENAPAPLDLTLPPKMAAVPPSPTGTEFSVQEAESGQSPSPPSAGAAAIAAAGGPANSTVHRVQLDFKPTMDDELELHAGQIVRLLHEYDDGWGGPRGPPVNPQGRPQGPPMSGQRGPGPKFPPGNRPMGPPGGPPGGPLPPLGPNGRPRDPWDLPAVRDPPWDQDLDHSLPRCNVLNLLPVSDLSLLAHKVSLDGLNPLVA